LVEAAVSDAIGISWKPCSLRGRRESDCTDSRAVLPVGWIVLCQVREAENSWSPHEVSDRFPVCGFDCLDGAVLDLELWRVQQFWIWSAYCGCTCILWRFRAGSCDQCGLPQKPGLEATKMNHVGNFSGLECGDDFRNRFLPVLLCTVTASLHPQGELSFSCMRWSTRLMRRLRLEPSRAQRE